MLGGDGREVGVDAVAVARIGANGDEPPPGLLWRARGGVRDSDDGERSSDAMLRGGVGGCDTADDEYREWEYERCRRLEMV